MSYENWLNKEEKRLREAFERYDLKDETFEEFARKNYEKEKAQEVVFKKMLKKHGQRCVHCRKLLALKKSN